MPTRVSKITLVFVALFIAASGVQHGGASLAGVNFVSLEGIQKLLEELWKEDGG